MIKLIRLDLKLPKENIQLLVLIESLVLENTPT